MECRDVLPLVPLYLDGELVEAQAAPLRKHLLACPACREHAQSEKALKRWFVPVPEVAVPTGFAERVALRAFHGEPAAAGAAPLNAQADLGLRRFVLWAVAAAALVLLTGSIALQLSERPRSDRLQASELPELWKQLEAPERGARPAEPAHAPAPKTGAARPRGER